MRKQEVAVCSVVLLFVFFSTSSVLADERTEARRHFRRGMELVVAGQLDAGIAELQAAYEILPHPNVLYNIGRAYAEGGRYDEALDYFERYLASGPPDTEEVRGYVAALHDRIAARQAREAAAQGATTTTETTEATTSEATQGGAALRGTAEEIAELRGAADRFEALARALGTPELANRATSLRAMADQMERANSGTPTTSTSGSTTPTAATTAPTNGNGMELGTGANDTYEERFVSSTRAALDPLDAPNSTTIITRQDIRLTGITSIGELLRRVAGVQVMTTGPAETNVAVRGFNQRLANRMLMLINGRSTYIDPLGITTWGQQPISVEDIERIEVVRGPASALYGANGFSGIVNVITRTPGDEPGTEFAVRGGNGDVLRGYAGTNGRGGKDGRIGYRFSVAYEQADRFVLPGDRRRVDLHQPTTTTDNELSMRNVRANLHVTYRLGPHSQAYTELGTLYFNPNVFGGSQVFNDFYLRGTFATATAGVTSNWGGLRFFWNNVTSDVDQWGPRPLISNVTWNTYDVEGTFAHEFHTGAIHQNIVAGAGYRRKFVDWPGVTDVVHYENHFQGFVQDSIRIGQRVTFVAGTRVDRHPLLARPVISPRGALVIRAGERQAIRASVTTAFRTPTFLESYTRIYQQTPISAASVFAGGSEVFHQTFGTPLLKAERILSSEIGYQNSESEYFTFDIAAYANRITDLLTVGTSTQFLTIASSLDPRYASISGFDPASNTFVAGIGGYVNDPGQYWAGGAEISGRVYPIDGLDIYANYSLNVTYYDVGGDLVRKHTAPTHQFNTGVQFRRELTERVGFDFALDVHAQARTVWDEQRVVGNGIQVVGLPLDPLYMINSRVGIRLLHDRLNLGVIGYNINALWGPNYRQHPLTQPIGTRIMASAAYRF